MNHVKLIEFYTETCANCKSFAKEYKELAKQLKGVIKVTAVDCVKEKKICSEYDVKTYPTLKVIPPGGFGVQDYSGERTAKAVYPWVMKFFSHFVEKVTADNIEAFLNKNAGKYKTLLFTDKPKTPLLWRGVRLNLKLPFVRQRNDRRPFAAQRGFRGEDDPWRGEKLGEGDMPALQSDEVSHDSSSEARPKETHQI